MLYNSVELEGQAILQTAARMCAAARTAPKTHGKDILHTLTLTGAEKDALADKMEEIGRNGNSDAMLTWYGRDSANLRAAQAVVLIGAQRKARNLPGCGYCGFEDCAACVRAGGGCSWMYVDLGVAASSAACIAAADMVDCRIMYSVGKAAAEMTYVPNCVWLGIPISISGKNIFFDRGISFK